MQDLRRYAPGWGRYDRVGLELALGGGICAFPTRAPTGTRVFDLRKTLLVKGVLH